MNVEDKIFGLLFKLTGDTISEIILGIIVGLLIISIGLILREKRRTR